jgi:aspartate/methionine/tyrosine aminotransferase
MWPGCQLPVALLQRGCGVDWEAFMSSSESAPQAFRPVPRTGVIFVTTEAQKRGFDPASPDWCNLGQGQPETGDLPGAPPRIEAVAVDPADQEYAPIAGLWELREAIASHYNRTYRRGPSQYSAENVSVSGGGRTSLTVQRRAWD